MDSERPGSTRVDSASGVVDDAEVTRRRSLASTRRAAERARFWRNVRLGISAMLCLASALVGTFLGNIARNSKSGAQMLRTTFGGWAMHPLDPLAGYRIDAQLPAEKQSTINLLLLGCDVDYEPGRPVILKNARGRSDSIMIAKMDFVNKTVNVLSIPRDTAVHVPGHGITKINAANALSGPELTAQTIKETFGIDTDYYVSINFETFRKIVDQVGGVDINVEKKLDYDDNWGHLHVHLKPGPQHLDGYKAMGYVRIRHSDDDLHRAARQHAFLEAIRAQVKTPGIFNKVPTLMNTVFEDVHTNLKQDQLIAIANWVRSVPKENVQMETMPSFEGYSYVTVNIPKAEETVKRLFFNNLVPVNINAPGMSIVENFTGHGKKHKKGDKSSASKPAANGTDDPLEPIMDDPSTVSPPETGADPGAKSGDNSTPPTTSGDNGKSGAESGGAEGNKNGTKSGPDPKPAGGDPKSGPTLL